MREPRTDFYEQRDCCSQKRWYYAAHDVAHGHMLAVVASTEEYASKGGLVVTLVDLQCVLGTGLQTLGV